MTVHKSFRLEGDDLRTLQVLGHSQNFKSETEVVRYGLQLVREKYHLRFSPEDVLTATKKSKQVKFITADSTDLMKGFEHFLGGHMTWEEIEDYKRERAVEGERYKIEDWWIWKDRIEELEKFKEEFKTKHRG